MKGACYAKGLKGRKLEGLENRKHVCHVSTSNVAGREVESPNVGKSEGFVSSREGHGRDFNVMAGLQADGVGAARQVGGLEASFATSGGARPRAFLRDDPSRRPPRCARVRPGAWRNGSWLPGETGWGSFRSSRRPVTTLRASTKKPTTGGIKLRWTRMIRSGPPVPAIRVVCMIKRFMTPNRWLFGPERGGARRSGERAGPEQAPAGAASPEADRRVARRIRLERAEKNAGEIVSG